MFDFDHFPDEWPWRPLLGDLLQITTGYWVFQLSLRFLYSVSGLIGVSSRNWVCGRVYSGVSILVSNYSATWASLKIREKVGGREGLPRSITLSSDMLLCTTLIITVTYLLSGGRLVDTLPSHVSYPGAFARDYVLVTNRGLHPSPAMKQAVRGLGARHGCHHCGVFVEHYIADHQPPTTLYAPGRPPQRLYPQCRACSLFQGGVLAHPPSLFSKRGVVRYSWSVRPWMFWLPYHVLVEGVFGASSNLERAAKVNDHFWVYRLFS